MWTVLWTIIRKARNHCQDVLVDNCGDEDHCQDVLVDNSGDEDHCQYHLGIDHSKTGNCCQDRELSE